MDREIKFRAWDDGEMVYSHNQLDWFFEVIREDAMIMQYTGRKDKNGKEIYEGDVCFADSREYPANKQVVWNKGRACFEFDYPLGKSLLQKDSIEVIGNIYENPELL